ncbi:hypothetical protein IL306_012165 [Fusarium sp. DS 682]|nr:hypothetical protein IL306_012165 [Fusarium sp. DS 682]
MTPAILGVGILCNAMQIITFAKDSLHAYRNIRDGRSPDPKLDSYLKNATATFNEMNQTTAQMGPLNQTQQQIVDVSKKVHECVDELQQKFAKLHIDDASKHGIRGRATAFKKGVATLWRGKELKEAEKSLQRHEQLLHSLLLDHICSQSQAAEIASLQSFQNLAGVLQSIISQVVKGTTAVSDLVIDFSSKMSDRLVEEHAATREAIGDHITSAENNVLLSISQSMGQLRLDMIQREQDKAFEKQQEQLLSSLRFPEMNSRKNQISTNYPGTFNWIFNEDVSSQSDSDSLAESGRSDDGSQMPEDNEDSDMDSYYCPSCNDMNGQSFSDCFIGWLESSSNLFWLSGKPASGKSFLMKFLALNRLTVEHLHMWRSNARILTHFFWKPGQLLERNVQGMALSLLYQVLDGRPDLSRRLSEAHPSVQHKKTHPDWSLDELTNALIWVLEASQEAFCIFLDGLDEAKELEHLPWPDWTNAQVVHKLLGISNVKLCASSREEPAFCTFFEGAPRLRVHQLNHRDITHFVRERLDHYGLNPCEWNILVYKTVEKSEGVFLWVALVVDSLNRAIRQSYTTIDMPEERLEQTPSDLTTLYIDMWDRMGDDGQLPSVRVTASRYFSLAIVARKMNDYQWATNYHWAVLQDCMSSLLLLATAAEDGSMESMLITGRSISVEELLNRCSKVEEELKLVCRGLLEVNRPRQNSSFIEWKGDERLWDYNSAKVEFIHRSAFDFLMDTEPGRQCLRTSGSSEREQSSRLLAAHLIRAQFLYVKSGQNPRWMHIWNIARYRAIDSNPYLQMAIHIAFHNRLFAERQFRDGLLDVLKEWQLSGLFGGHIYWALPACSRAWSNSLELEFIEAGISAAFSRSIEGAIVDMKSLVDKCPASLLVNAIPVVIRAFLSMQTEDYGIKGPSEVLKYIFCRLERMTPEDAEDQGVVKNAKRTLHRWYIIHCLEFLSSGNMGLRAAGNLDTELLSQLSDTLTLEGDWHHPVLFEFQGGGEFQFEIFQGPESVVDYGPYALVVGNFATAYALLDKVMFHRFSRTLDTQIPHSVISRFDILLIADFHSDSADYYTPGLNFHDQIEDILWDGLLIRATFEEESWPAILNGPSSDLMPMEDDKVVDYVLHELKERGVEFIYVVGIMWLGDKVERAQSIQLENPASIDRRN